MNLYSAHEQWATRPADERFIDLASLRVAVGNRRDNCREKIVHGTNHPELPMCLTRLF